MTKTIDPIFRAEALRKSRCSLSTTDFDALSQNVAGLPGRGRQSLRRLRSSSRAEPASGSAKRAASSSWRSRAAHPHVVCRGVRRRGGHQAHRRRVPEDRREVSQARDRPVPFASLPVVLAPCGVHSAGIRFLGSRVRRRRVRLRRASRRRASAYLARADHAHHQHRQGELRRGRRRGGASRGRHAQGRRRRRHHGNARSQRVLEPPRRRRCSARASTAVRTRARSPTDSWAPTTPRSSSVWGKVLVVEGSAITSS